MPTVLNTGIFIIILQAFPCIFSFIFNVSKANFSNTFTIFKKISLVSFPQLTKHLSLQTSKFSQLMHFFKTSSIFFKYKLYRSTLKVKM